MGLRAYNAGLEISCTSILLHLSDVQALVLEPCIARLVDVIQAELVAVTEHFREDVICR